jgi:hypothetical protein
MRHAMHSPDRLFHALVVVGASLTGGVVGCGSGAQPADSPGADAAVDAADAAVDAVDEQAAHDAAGPDVYYATIHAICANGSAWPCTQDARPPMDANGEDAGGPDASIVDASIVDASGDGGCGPCAANQVCVHPWNCGGTSPGCVAVTDAAACQAGWTFETNCGPLVSSGPGCKPPPCVNPPPSCVDVPSGCSSNLTCGCLNSLCESVCSTVQGHDVMCGGA